MKVIKTATTTVMVSVRQLLVNSSPGFSHLPGTVALVRAAEIGFRPDSVPPLSSSFHCVFLTSVNPIFFISKIGMYNSYLWDCLEA